MRMLFTPPLAPLTPADLALAAVIGLALPLFTWIEHQRDRRRETEGRSRPLVQRYRQSMLMLWGASALVVAAWIGAGRPLADLGLTVSGDIWFIAALAAAVLISLLYGSQVLTLRRSATARAQLRRMLEQQQGVDSVMPNTPEEMRAFRWIALTAGVCEELLFRGFLIWAIAHWMPVWAAAIVALIIFTLAHLYQGTARALAGVVVAAAVMTVLFLMSGSLLPGMLLHFVVDLAGGEMTWAAKQARDDAESEA
jgi:uncharacterized protein